MKYMKYCRFRNNYKQGCRTVSISKICPYCEGQGAVLANFIVLISKKYTYF